MKIKALTRSLDSHLPTRKGDAPTVSHNLDPALHPFSKPREYTRAVNAAKLDRMHAKPFVTAFEGHVDGVYCLAKDPNRIGVLGSGSGDGGENSFNVSALCSPAYTDHHRCHCTEIRLWDMPTQTLMATYPRAHHGIISSLVISPINFAQYDLPEGSTAEANSRSGGRRLLSCGTDRTIKLWDADPRRDRFGPSEYDSDEDEEQIQRAGTTGGGVLGGSNPWKTEVERSEPLQIWHCKTAINSLSHHASSPIFASASSSVQTWDITRGGNSTSSSSSGALRDMTWGAESINVVRFNQSEKDVLAGAGSDRGVVLYDLRSGKPLTKMVMKVCVFDSFDLSNVGGLLTGLHNQMRANDIAWSPIEPTVFAVASEDHNMYTFDMRNLNDARQIYKDHVSAVMSVDWSPTGQDLVTGSYDRTVRLWSNNRGNHSRDVYHTSRMQRVFTTLYTLDARYVVSGSDDGNVRLWKSRASEKLGIQAGKERAQREYRQQLVKRWSNVGDVAKINKQRRVPKAIKTAQKLKRTMLEAERVKEERRRKHTKAGESKPKAARKDAVLAQKE